jgi:SAM-dependent methyltransferase
MSCVSTIRHSRRFETALSLILLLNLFGFDGNAQSLSRSQRRPLRRPDVIFVPTPPETVEEMLRLARIKPGDVLYDLGSGDGRIPIRAAEKYGIRAVGIDIDPKMVAIAEAAAQRADVADKVRFRNEDLYRADFREATIVTLYLSDVLNLKLRPKLLRELKPGTRIISHDFRMGDWPPEQTVRVPWQGLYRTVYVWTIPKSRRRGL